MFSKQSFVGIALLISLVSTVSQVQAVDLQFKPVPNFLALPAGLKLGQCSAVATDSKGQVYLFHRGERPILCFDTQGKLVKSWGDDLIGKAHGMRIDQGDNVWVTDIGRHVVHKFDPSGKLLLTLGKLDQLGAGTDQFNMPTDVAFGGKDELYISDGYGNARVMKFTAGGKFIKTWGHKGPGPGEFDTPHAIRVDSAGRVLVADRENKRIQLFESDGKLLHIWPGFAPYGLALAADGTVFVADGLACTVLKLDRGGMVAQSWGREGTAPGEYKMPHGLEVDRAGNLLVSEIAGMRMQKFERQ